jgi:ATPase subunit of ABC transporter with duplicated ATPase domains
VRLGASLYMGYFAQQSLDVLNPDLTVIEQLQQDFPRDGLGALRTLAGAFQFSGEDVDKKIRALSGGEKSRLAIGACSTTRRTSSCSTNRRITWILRPRRCWWTL